ncbi:MAG: hypothetical protein A2Y12_00465 [Planctomycetes bacterium GWF2_42_9]|nr:MAG: hypothetical protein A2Y12_00465 [Planctomycetes bacterium GWF2_42_9]
MAVTIQQIAQKVGVAPSTVSAALSDVCKKRISQVRINQIRKVADSLGYIPNLSARRLRTGKTFNIGVVIPSFLNHHPISEYFSLVSQECIKRNYNAMPLVVERQYSEIAKYTSALDNHHVDGLLFLDFIMDGYDQYMQIWQSNRSMIFRMLDPLLASVPFDGVVTNHYKSGKNLIEHVISQGWTDVVLVAEAMPSKRRDTGSWRAWKEYVCCAGLDYSKNEIVYEKRIAMSRFDAVKAFVDSGRVQNGRTALLLDGGDGVTAVYGALAEAGLVVGKDVAVAAMNTVPTNEYVNPQLTVISEPRGEIARVLVETLLQKIEGEPIKSVSIDMYEPKLITGPSTVRSY